MVLSFSFRLTRGNPSSILLVFKLTAETADRMSFGRVNLPNTSLTSVSFRRRRIMAQTLSSKYSFRTVLLKIVALLACFEHYRSLTFGENLSNYGLRSLYCKASRNKRDIRGKREPVSLVNS